MDSLNLRDNLTATSGGVRVGFKNSCPAVRRDIPEPENSMEGICPSLRESSKIAKKLN